MRGILRLGLGGPLQTRSFPWRKLIGYVQRDVSGDGCCCQCVSISRLTFLFLTCTLTHALTRARAHRPHTHARTHAHAQTTHARTRTHARTHAHKFNADVHTLTHKHARTHACTHIHTHTHERVKERGLREAGLVVWRREEGWIRSVFLVTQGAQARSGRPIRILLRRQTARSTYRRLLCP